MLVSGWQATVTVLTPCRGSVKSELGTDHMAVLGMLRRLHLNFLTFVYLYS